MQNDPHILQNAKMMADALTALFGTRVETVVHHVASQTIAYIANPLSHREIGDPSNIDDIDLSTSGPVIGPYEKINWDGSLIRSISVAQKSTDGTTPYLVCINFDQSDLEAARRAIQVLMPNAASNTQPKALFRNDWHERVNVFVTDWCQSHSTSVDRLDRQMRRDLLRALDDSGALSEKNAAAYVARVLGVSRATVYNDLKQQMTE